MAEIRAAMLYHGTLDSSISGAGETFWDVGVLIPKAISSPRETPRVFIFAWCQYALGAGATAVIPRVRRGTTTAAPLVGEANSEALKTAAFQDEPVFIAVVDEAGLGGKTQYEMTIETTGQTGGATVRHRSMLALVL